MNARSLLAVVISNDHALWAFLGVVVTVAGGLITYRWAKPHDERIDDANSLAQSITAIGDAAVKVVGASTDVSEMMQSFLAPLRSDLDEQKRKVSELTERHRVEIDELREAFAHDQEQCAVRLDTLVSHVNLLRFRMRENGIDPGPPPDLDGFTFD